EDDGKLVAQSVHAAYHLLDGQRKDGHPTDVQQVVGAPLKSTGGAYVRATAGTGDSGALAEIANHKTQQRRGFGKQVGGDGQATLTFGNRLEGLRVNQLRDVLILHEVRAIWLGRDAGFAHIASGCRGHYGFPAPRGYTARL